MIPVLSRSRIVAIPAAEPAPTGLKRPKPDRWSPRYDAGWGYLSPPKMLTNHPAFSKIRVLTDSS